jgi:predicted ferric reductase
MQKRRIGNLVIVAAVVLNVTLWLAFPPVNDLRKNFYVQYLGEIFSTSALLLMASNIFISTRPRFLEPFFGGLDQMYQTHKKTAIMAIILILTHFFIMTLGGARLAISLGKIALIGLLTIVILSLATRIPFIGGYINLKYNQWRIIHKFIGVFFLIGLLHMLSVQNLLQTTPVVHVYVLSIAYSGAVLYLYKELLQPFLKRKHPYQVEGVRRLNGSVIEVTLKPIQRKFSHLAGQFMFIDFRGDRKLSEAHPFTISSAPVDEHLKLTIKTSGDFTQHLYENLEPGQEARIEGGYGMFNYKTARPKQVWIAGGIGLTPFLSWIRDFDSPSGFEIDFFLTTRVPEEALFLDEFEQTQSKYPNFHLHLHFSNRDGRLTLEKIIKASGEVSGKEFFLCGPLPMTLSMKSQLMAAGVPASDIHYEEFSFR